MGLINYIKETKGEMKHVSWPTKKQATAYTILVIVVSLILSAYLGLFDWLFTTGLNKIIEIDTNQTDFNPSEFIETSTSTTEN